MRRAAVVLAIALGSARVLAQTSEPQPETCLARNAGAIASATYNGKTYRFTSTECREQFLSDPERFSQLYDALEEMAAAGLSIEAEAEASLVPS